MILRFEEFVSKQVNESMSWNKTIDSEEYAQFQKRKDDELAAFDELTMNDKLIYCDELIENIESFSMDENREDYDDYTDPGIWPAFCDKFGLDDEEEDGIRDIVRNITNEALHRFVEDVFSVFDCEGNINVMFNNFDKIFTHFAGKDISSELDVKISTFKEDTDENAGGYYVEYCIIDGKTGDELTDVVDTFVIHPDELEGKTGDEAYAIAHDIATNHIDEIRDELIDRYKSGELK